MLVIVFLGIGLFLVYLFCLFFCLVNFVNKDLFFICVCVYVCLGYLICVKIKIDEKINLCRLELNVLIL